MGQGTGASGGRHGCAARCISGIKILARYRRAYPVRTRYRLSETAVDRLPHHVCERSDSSREIAASLVSAIDWNYGEDKVKRNGSDATSPSFA